MAARIHCCASRLGRLPGGGSRSRTQSWWLWGRRSTEGEADSAEAGADGCAGRDMRCSDTGRLRGRSAWRSGRGGGSEAAESDRGSASDSATLERLMLESRLTEIVGGWLVRTEDTRGVNGWLSGSRTPGVGSKLDVEATCRNSDCPCNDMRLIWFLKTSVGERRRLIGDKGSSVMRASCAFSSRFSASRSACRRSIDVRRAWFASKYGFSGSNAQVVKCNWRSCRGTIVLHPQRWCGQAVGTPGQVHLCAGPGAIVSYRVCIAACRSGSEASGRPPLPLCPQ